MGSRSGRFVCICSRLPRDRYSRIVTLVPFGPQDTWRMVFEHAIVVVMHTPHTNLRALAEQAMRKRGFLLGIPPDAEQQLNAEVGPSFDGLKALDLTAWLWSSIDNDESKDLDQIDRKSVV